MEKRISSTEYRLGIYESWPINFNTKYYTDSLRFNILLYQILKNLQNKTKMIMPLQLIKYFINNKILNFHISYFQIRFINKSQSRNIKKELNDDTTLIFKKSNLKLKKNILPFLKSKLKKKIKTKFIITELKKCKDKKPILISQIFYIYLVLQKKWLEFLLKELFQNLFYKSTILISITNLNLLLVSQYKKFPNKLFYKIAEWYKKIGGSKYNFNRNLIYLHYSISYKHLSPVILTILKTDLQRKPYQQRQCLNSFYNLILAYSEIQRNISGARICFKGTIGRHGRSKTTNFFIGRLYNFELIMPVEYSAININSIFGTIGIRLYFCFLDENYANKYFKQIIK
jgi:hypothetical protein